MGAVFIFLSFLLYGTYTTHFGEVSLQSLEITQCSSRYTDYMTSEIVRLRSETLPGELKELTVDLIQSRIHEFYLVTMNGDSVGCFRIFVPESIPHSLELGSVKSTTSGIGRIIVSQAESIAREKQKQIVAITGESYTKTMYKSGWLDATTEYPERMSESIQDKKLWLYNKL